MNGTRLLIAATGLLVIGGMLLALADQLDPSWVREGSLGEASTKALAASNRDNFYRQIEPMAVREGQVVLYNHAASFPDFWNGVVIPQFQEKYGVRVALHNVRSSIAQQQLVAAADARRPPPADVYFTGSAQLVSNLERRLILDLPLAEHLPHARHYAVSALRQAAGVDHGGRYLPFHMNQVALGYDSAQIPASEVPLTLDGLLAWAETHPGKFAWASPIRGGSGQALLVTVAHHAMSATCREWFFADASGATPVASDHNLRNSECLHGTWRWMRRLRRVTEITNGNADSLNLLANGHAWMTFAWEDQAYAYQNKHQLPPTFRMTLLKDGMAGGVDGLFIPAGARHVAAAALFIDFAMSASIQEWKRDHMASRSAHAHLAAPKGPVGLIPGHELSDRRTLPWPHPLMMKALVDGFVEHVLRYEEN